MLKKMAKEILPFEDIPFIQAKPRERSLEPFDPLEATMFIHNATDGPMYRFCIKAADGPVESVWLNDEKGAKQILLDEEGIWRKGPQTYEPFASLVPLHLISLEGEYHSKMRVRAQTALNDALASGRIPGDAVRQRLVDNIQRAIADPTFKTWMGVRAELNGKTCLVTSTMDRILRSCALDIVTSALFGKSWGVIEDYTATNVKANALAELMHELHWRVADFTEREWRKSPRAGPAGRLLDTLDKFVLDEIDISRAKFASNPERPSDRMLDDWAKDESISTEEIRNLAMTFLTMGSENVSTALSWCLVLFSEHPREQEEARKSFDKLLVCFEETMRLYPSVPVLTRTCTQETILCGHHIPRFTEVVVNMYAIHRQVGTWGDQSTEYIPSRCPVISTLGPPDAFPFGAGKRACVGRPLTNFELKTVLFPLIQTFQVVAVRPIAKEDNNDVLPRFEVDDQAKTKPNNFVSFRPGPHLIAFIPREQSSSSFSAKM